IVVKRSCKH
ncbi:hypothetical protein D047_3704B, partial [Vibrio parahaemolyticus VPTS-2010_2]